MTRHTPDHEVELFRDGDAYTVVVDLPEVSRDSIEVRYLDSSLHVEADTGEGSAGRSVLRRSVSVPHRVLEDEIRATYEDGVLEITLPVEEGTTPRGREIDVE